MYFRKLIKIESKISDVLKWTEIFNISVSGLRNEVRALSKINVANIDHDTKSNYETIDHLLVKEEVHVNNADDIDSYSVRKGYEISPQEKTKLHIDLKFGLHFYVLSVGL